MAAILKNLVSGKTRLKFSCTLCFTLGILSLEFLDSVLETHFRNSIL
jgi:hypothetical protein